MHYLTYTLDYSVSAVRNYKRPAIQVPNKMLFERGRIMTSGQNHHFQFIDIAWKLIGLQGSDTKLSAPYEMMISQSFQIYLR